MSFITENLLGIFVAIIVLLVVIKLKRSFSYFSDRGMPYIKPTLMDMINSIPFDAINKLPLAAYDRSRDSDSPYIGYFQALFKPAILIRDPSLMESVLIKDFSHFHDHGFNIDCETNPLAGHLFNMKGDKWRTLRHKLLPTFTSGKLRGMFPIIEDCADDLIKVIKQDPSLSQETELKELFKRYSLAVITSCAFGIDPESVKDPDCQFRQVLDGIMKPGLMTRIRLAIMMFPRIAKLFKIKVFFKDAEEFMLNLTKQTFEMRKKSGVKRNDFIQLLLELKEKGSVDLDIKDLEQDEKESFESFQPSDSPNAKLEFTDELLMAQMFVFLVGGFESSAYLISITMYALSKHPELQLQARDDIRQAIAKHGTLNYQSIRDMKFLQACIDEALRLYTPGMVLFRECNKAYTLSDGKVIEKGMTVMIPSKSFHLDSKYWADPEKFDPNRFLCGEAIRSGTYLPFGMGPRLCIAQRLALLESKLMLAKLLLNFELLTSSKTKEPLKIKATISVEIEGGLWGTFRDLSTN